MKKTIVKYMSVILAGYLILFAFRLTYGYLNISEQAFQNIVNEFVADSRSVVRNYASEKKVLKNEKQVQVNANPNISVDQKYEKVAAMASKTTNFTSDEIALRKCIADSSALVQFEQNSGMADNRRLHLIIGVQPEKFDFLVGEINKIGAIVSIEINKIDKTSEYKSLKANRMSLEKSRTSLENLRKLNGSVQEMIELEGKILENEQAMQKLGVQLKEFDEECEFCTIKFTLAEYKETRKAEISFMHRVKVAFEWSVVYYVYFLEMLVLALLISLFLIVIIGKLKWLPDYINQFNKQ